MSSNPNQVVQLEHLEHWGDAPLPPDTGSAGDNPQLATVIALIKDILIRVQEMRPT
jgi:hypothetical protein